MYNYLQLIEKLYYYQEIKKREDRTGTGTVSIFGYNLEYDFNLTEKFPLLTLREMNFKNIVVELLWFLRGESNIEFLENHGCKWWTYQCDKNGNVGPMYGKQWRGYTDENSVVHPDQFKRVIETLRKNPTSRRMVINSWEVSKIPEDNCDYEGNVEKGLMALPPCHNQIQFYVDENIKKGEKYLSLMFSMRSSDVFLGLPANIASYALLLHIVAGLVGMKPHRLIYNGADVHLYTNHLEATKIIIDRAILKSKEYVTNEKSHIIYNLNEDVKRSIAIEESLPTFEIPKEFFDIVNVEDLDFSDERLVDILCSGLKDYKPYGPLTVRMAR